MNVPMQMKNTKRMKHTQPDLTIALSVDSLAGRAKAECALRTMMNPGIKPPGIIRAGNEARLIESVRHGIALTIMRMAGIVKNSDIAGMHPVVTVTIRAPDSTYLPEAAHVRHMIESAVVAEVLGTCFEGYMTPDPLEGIPGL